MQNLAFFIFGIIFLYIELINMNADIIFKDDKELVNILKISGAFMCSIVNMIILRRNK